MNLQELAKQYVTEIGEEEIAKKTGKTVNAVKNVGQNQAIPERHRSGSL